MELESVSDDTAAGSWYLPFDDVNTIDNLAYKARAILATIRVASTGNNDLPDDAIPGACWAVESMIEQIEAIATKKRGCSHERG